jgi:hypothetical protein
MNHIRNKLISFTLTMVLITTIIPITPAKEADAEVIYITVGYFSRLMSNELGLSPIGGNNNTAYVNALLDKGIMKDDDFISYTDWLTRGDAMVLLNRADEYLYGDKLDKELVQTAISKRISDISKVKESKREDVTKAYLKGYMKGYSNGEYSTDRDMRVNNKIPKSDTLSCIKKLKDKNLRSKVSPDGQLIRTTNLPVYAKYYPYILASYPNEYYDWQFIYEKVTRRVNGKIVELINLQDYSSPIDVNKVTEYGDLAEIKSERLDIWVEEAKEFLNNLLNVDYRTIDESWIDRMIETNDAFEYNEDMIRYDMEKYITGMKKNKTIVECNSVDIDGSSLYYFNGTFYLRAHVNFRVVSSVASLNESIDSLNESESHNNILFSPTFVNIRLRELGKWQDGYYEVRLNQYNGVISGSYVEFNDAVYRGRKVMEYN